MAPFTFAAELARSGELREWNTEVSVDRADLLEADIGRTMTSAREVFLQAVAAGAMAVEPGVVLSYVLIDGEGAEVHRVSVSADRDSSCAVVASMLDYLQPQVTLSMAAKVLGVH